MRLPRLVLAADDAHKALLKLTSAQLNGTQPSCSEQSTDVVVEARIMNGRSEPLVLYPPNLSVHRSIGGQALQSTSQLDTKEADKFPQQHQAHRPAAAGNQHSRIQDIQKGRQGCRTQQLKQSCSGDICTHLSRLVYAGHWCAKQCVTLLRPAVRDICSRCTKTQWSSSFVSQPSNQWLEASHKSDLKRSAQKSSLESNKHKNTSCINPTIRTPTK
jgi:hypothetical protein